MWFYNQRAGAENLIKEANNDAGLAAHPSGRWAANCVHFQLAMLAYNLNCWLLLFNREESVETNDLKHTTLATARLRFLFVAAKIWRHAGRVGISYSDQYAERGLFQRLMDRLRHITAGWQDSCPCSIRRCQTECIESYARVAQQSKHLDQRILKGENRLDSANNQRAKQSER